MTNRLVQHITIEESTSIQWVNIYSPRDVLLTQDDELLKMISRKRKTLKGQKRPFSGLFRVFRFPENRKQTSARTKQGKPDESMSRADDSIYEKGEEDKEV